jgi:class 3 adenylate cyclase/tetratricopeptide (TPR) repeat protein
VSAADLTQRLAAILAADVAGYSRLMSLDERATVAALEAARAVFRERVASSRGRVIDTAGDSVLAVFETATGAVAAALAIQAELAGLVAEAPDDRRMRFRIGVHLGDVIEKADGTVYGDGVNIAARLQALAEPGGITVSESIRTAVRGKVGASFTDEGARPMKNIDAPVRAYRVEPESGVTRESTRETDETSLPLPDRSSIAVLPFTNMSGDPEQEYFADGIVEDITTELSRFSLEAEEMRLLERGRRRFTEADDTAWRAFKARLDAIFIGDAALAAEALRLAERAVEQDRACRMAWYVLARSHSTRVVFGWSDDRQRSLAAAQRAAETLMTLAPGDSRSYQARGQIALLSGDLARGAADQRRAYELNPNDTTTTFILSWTEAAAGNVARARELAAQAIRMSPKDRLIGFAYLARALSAFIERDLPKVREWAELAIQSHPAAPVRRMLMIAYAAETGDTALLRTHLEKLRSVAPDFVPSVLRGDYRPFHRPEHLALLLDSLRKVGLEA